ncbi:unnamed protein product [Chrysodeixis includens]|uniref:Zinc finger CW-type PWWP domain protein 1 n=1 Tax=Chrysodeixis includens TaxID=689277 RepID=A0A9P0C301_CHRIL|nr:unnamed protein product [Chrysodeixis includens]
MKRADLPKETASEPGEEAHQPFLSTKMPPNQSKKLTFAKNVDQGEKTSSQISSSYKEVLSQPPTEMSHSQKLIWLQKRRTAGLWAQCDDCNQWRYLPDILDRQELPKKWFCSMNPDKEFNSCSVPEAPLRIHDEEDLIHSEYSAGSLVWARMAGWPWWPAMVDDCPDVEQFYWLDGFSDIPTHYNVVFFDSMEVTRAWIAPDQLKPYVSNKKLQHISKIKKYNNRLKVAMSQADAAAKMTLENRLAEYSFISRHKGLINSPKKIKKNDLTKYQKQFKNKFNIEFPIEISDSEEDIEVNLEMKRKKNNNVIMLGTPKRSKKEKRLLQKGTEDKGQDNDETKVERNTNESNMPPLPDTSKAGTATSGQPDGNTDKPPNSMLVQVGSTQADSMDNDTSTTYFLPDNTTQPFSITMDTPNSDDFDF